MKCKYPLGSDECGKFLKSTYKDSIVDTVILDESLYEYFEEYDLLLDEISKLENMKKIIEHKIQNELREYETGFCKERKVTWKSVTKNSIDSKKLKIELPEVYKIIYK